MQQNLHHLLITGRNYITATSEKTLAHKPTYDKWSKKEILGHLIDSAVHNLNRFTKIQFEEKPFVIHSYNQDALVKANMYQTADTKDMLELWWFLNLRILKIIDQQSERTLSYQIILPKGEARDLRFLIEDYVSHLEHHLDQMLSF